MLYVYLLVGTTLKEIGDCWSYCMWSSEIYCLCSTRHYIHKCHCYCLSDNEINALDPMQFKNLTQLYILYLRNNKVCIIARHWQWDKTSETLTIAIKTLDMSEVYDMCLHWGHRMMCATYIGRGNVGSSTYNLKDVPVWWTHTHSVTTSTSSRY